MKNLSFRIWVTMCIIASILSLGGRFSHNEKMMLTGVFMFSCLIFIICILGVLDTIRDFLHQIALTKKTQTGRAGRDCKKRTGRGSMSDFKI